MRPKHFTRFFLVLLTGCFSASLSAQTAKTDSLRTVLTGNVHDTAYAGALNALGLEYYGAEPDSAMACWMRTVTFCTERKDQHSGISHKRMIYLEADALNNIGFIYTNRGMTTPSLEYNFRSLHLREEMLDTHGIAESLNNIAFVYGLQEDTAKALEYYAQSAGYYQAIRDYGGVAYTKVNRARIYVSQKNDSLALRLYLDAKATLETLSDQKRGYGTCLSSIGMIYLRQQNYDECGNYLRRSLAVRMEANDRGGVAASYVNIGKLYESTGKRDSAFWYATRAYTVAREVRNAAVVINSAELLSRLYEAAGNSDEALRYYRIYVGARDSLKNDENEREMLRQQMGYEYEQQAAEDSLNFQREREVEAVKLSRQRGYTIGGFSALAVVAVLLFFVYRQRNAVTREKERSDELLLNILPAETANELKQTGTAQTKEYSSVTVLFTDFRNFTKTAEQLSATELVALINTCYGAFDAIVSRYGVEKIKTIGDSYMCAGGIPVENTTHPQDVVRAALEMLSFIQSFNEKRREQGLPFFDIRIGVHTGPVVAGIVGTRKFAYDIWGDTVNIASRMESSGEAGRVNISRQTYELIRDGDFLFEHRGKIQAKNKGEIDMYFVTSVRSSQ